MSSPIPRCLQTAVVLPARVLVAVSPGAGAQQASCAGSGAVSAPLFCGEEVTGRGPYLCLVKQFRQGEHHIAVVYAFDGSEQIQGAVRKVPAQYPLKAMEVAAAERFQKLVDRDLLYYLYPSEVEQKVYFESDWRGWPAEVAGRVVLRDSKR